MDQDQARATFLEYLDRGRDGALDESVIEILLLDTKTPLPDEACDLVGVEYGTSYAHAVTELLLHLHERANSVEPQIPRKGDKGRDQGR
jgi:hypothetical protein